MDKKRILVVDDEPQFVTALKARLEANGYDVGIATNGKDALDAVGKALPDAILLDLSMPQMDGLETLKRLRKHHAQLPIFILTASSDDRQFVKAGKWQPSGIIVKTNDLQKEIQNISSALSVSGKFTRPA